MQLVIGLIKDYIVKECFDSIILVISALIMEIRKY